MEKKTIRLLKAEEIECRVSTVNEKGVTLLLYKEARVDQKILDEAFGPFGWQRSHQNIDGNLYCTVSVYDKETNTWISKQDVGSTNFAEKEKSQASDSFKRACVNWGIGRERLYLRREKLSVLFPLANIEEIADALEKQGVLETGKKNRTMQLSALNGMRFYVIPLHCLNQSDL